MDTKILVVDDSQLTRQRVKDLLLSHDVASTVLTAKSGQEALTLLSTQKVSLILCDVEMPGLGGLRLLNIVQSIPDCAGIPLLLMTGRSDTVSKIRGLTEGAVDYLTKPFEEQELLARVRVQLRLKALQDELRSKNARLEQLNRTDFLTQLSNRRHLMDLLTQELERSSASGEPLSLLLIDVDHFKFVNDEFGHPVGDRCLRLVADTLSSHAGELDSAARFGGEEFAVVLPATDAVGASAVAERMRSAVESVTLVIEGREVPFTVSLGIATYTGPAVGSLEKLIKEADEALYAAKDAGRNRVSAISPRPRASWQPANAQFDDSVG